MNSKLLAQATGLSLVFLFYSLSASAADPEAEDCVPKSCGAVVDISYPFWLSEQQPSYCGYPQFGLLCRNGTLLLPTSSAEYLVREIFYHNHSLVVADSEFLHAHCLLPVYSLTFSLSSFSVSSANRMLFFFRNCTESLPGYYRAACADDKAFSYLGGSFQTREHLGSSSTCESAVVPVLGYPGANGSDYSALLRNGFLLEWTAADCTDCRESHGQCGYNLERNSFMCICSDQTHSRSCIPGKGKGKTIAIVVTAGTSSIFLVFLLICLYLFRAKKSHNQIIFWKSSKRPPSIESFLEKNGSLAPKRYQYSDVKKMTKSFSDKLGQGGYGVVYKGKLHDGRYVAVKLLSSSKGNGEEFVNEVASIGRTSHVNVVRLVGFCYEGSKTALIYDFMPNGSLEKFIYSERSETIPLGWERLFNIAVGIARGLEYLHRGCNTRIVHFDIKPHNILLDQEFCPKISDFGLSKLCRPKESFISMCGARGTPGYIAPEVLFRDFGVISSKSDVYSYGMMVLEMVGGRKNVNIRAEKTSEIYFPHWIYEHIDQDGDLQVCGVTNETVGIARKMIIVGLWCIQIMPQSRPSISRVLEMLEGSIDGLQLPPKPSLSSPPRACGAPSAGST